MYYTTRERAEKEQKRWFEIYGEWQEIYDIPTNTKWKCWLSTKDKWEKELKCLERREQKLKLKKLNKV